MRSLPSSWCYVVSELLLLWIHRSSVLLLLPPPWSYLTAPHKAWHRYCSVFSIVSVYLQTHFSKKCFRKNAVFVWMGLRVFHVFVLPKKCVRRKKAVNTGLNTMSGDLLFDLFCCIFNRMKLLHWNPGNKGMKLIPILDLQVIVLRGTFLFLLLRHSHQFSPVWSFQQH